MRNVIKNKWKNDSEFRRKIKENSMMGYNNFDFKANKLHVYEKIKFDFMYLLSKTNLTDKIIVNYLHKKYNCRFKIQNLIKYCLHYHNDSFCITKTEHIADPFSIFEKNRTIVRKTHATFNLNIYNSNLININDNSVIYYPYNAAIFDNLENIFKIYNDNTISDSMIYNKKIDEYRLFKENIKLNMNKVNDYLVLLGIIEFLGIEEINLKIRLPNSQRIIGKKSKYKVNEKFTQNFKLIKNKELEDEYTISYDGKTFRNSRVTI